MTKITLTNLANLQNENTAVSAINNNNAVLSTAFDNTLSRDGTVPNQMGNILDMNSNQIINLPAPSTVNSPARLIDVVSNPTITIPGTGTSGHVVPFLDGNNTFSGTNAFSSSIHVTGTSALDGVTTFGATPVLPANSIANASLGTMAANTVKGSIAGGTPADLTKTQATTLINPFTSSLSGAAPASGGGTTNFLRADATWANTNPNYILLNTLTAASSATLADTTSMTSAYSSYEIILINVVPATNTVQLMLQVHSGGTFPATAYICSSAIFSGSTVTSGTPTTFFPLSHTSVVNSTPGISGKILVSSVNTSGLHMWNYAGTQTQTGITVFPFISTGYWNSAAVIDGFQILFSSGNITSGTVKIYGLT